MTNYIYPSIFLCSVYNIQFSPCTHFEAKIWSKNSILLCHWHDKIYVTAVTTYMLPQWQNICYRSDKIYVTVVTKYMLLQWQNICYRSDKIYVTVVTNQMSWRLHCPKQCISMTTVYTIEIQNVTLVTSHQDDIWIIWTRSLSPKYFILQDS